MNEPIRIHSALKNLTILNCSMLGIKKHGVDRNIVIFIVLFLGVNWPLELIGDFCF